MVIDERLQTTVGEADQTVYDVRNSIYEARRRFGQEKGEFDKKIAGISQKLEPLTSLLDERIELIDRLIEDENRSSCEISSENDPNYKLVSSMRILRNVLDSGDLGSVHVYDVGVWLGPAHGFVYYWMVSSTEDELREVIRVQAELNRINNSLFNRKSKRSELEQEFERLGSDLEQKYQ